ncbi:MAG TPA: hemerythrin domain-containing protein [Actinomycetota bacterium]|nr:hemerythrin domain-containing protein [Actinomycetota bacterium]
MDAITLLKDDHRKVKELFSKYERAGNRAFATKKKLVDKITEELSVHAAIEEQVFYPSVREAIVETEDDVLESLEEHHIVKWTLSELEKMEPQDERYDAKVTVLIESVRHHIGEEEQDMFPKVRKALTRTQLSELGDLMERAKLAAPTRPHPRAPEEPPGNVIGGPVLAMLDAGKEAVKKVTGRGKKAS